MFESYFIALASGKAAKVFKGKSAKGKSVYSVLMQNNNSTISTLLLGTCSRHLFFVTMFSGAKSAKAEKTASEKGASSAKAEKTASERKSRFA